MLTTTNGKYTGHLCWISGQGWKKHVFKKPNLVGFIAILVFWSKPGFLKAQFEGFGGFHDFEVILEWALLGIQVNIEKFANW